MRIIFIISIALLTQFTFAQSVKEDLDLTFRTLDNLPESMVHQIVNDYMSDCRFNLRKISKYLGYYRLSANCNDHDIIDHLKNSSLIYNVQKSIRLDLRETPNDSLFDQQWSRKRIDLEAFWDVTTGGRTIQNDEVVVAVLDSSFDPEHEDLADNIWVNEGEIPDDGIDNDGNGYVDDFFGKNVKEKNGNLPLGQHGTSVSGVIGAKGNNTLDIAGVNWDVKIMLFTPIEQCPDVEEALMYVYDQRRLYNESNGTEGAYIVATNLSFGQSGLFAEDFPGLCMLFDDLGSVGILSIAAGPNTNTDIDVEGDLPNDCKSEYLISVTSTDFFDEKPSVRGYGKIGMDLSAPGEEVVLLRQLDRVFSSSGCSYAAPMVAGTVALLHSAMCDEFISMTKQNPGNASALLKSAVLDGVDLLSSLADITVSGGRLNAYNTLEIMSQSVCGGDSGGISEIDFISVEEGGNDIIIRLKINSFARHTLDFFDAAGRLIMSRSIPPTTQSTYDVPGISSAYWSSGGYIARLSDGDQCDSKRFVVTHSE